MGGLNGGAGYRFDKSCVDEIRIDEGWEEGVKGLPHIWPINFINLIYQSICEGDYFILVLITLSIALTYTFCHFSNLSNKEISVIPIDSQVSASYAPGSSKKTASGLVMSSNIHTPESSNPFSAPTTTLNTTASFKSVTP